MGLYYEFIGETAIHGPKPYEFIRHVAPHVSLQQMSFQQRVPPKNTPTIESGDFLALPCSW